MDLGKIPAVGMKTPSQQSRQINLAHPANLEPYRRELVEGRSILEIVRMIFAACGYEESPSKI